MVFFCFSFLVHASDARVKSDFRMKPGKDDQHLIQPSSNEYAYS